MLENQTQSKFSTRSTYETNVQLSQNCLTGQTKLCGTKGERKELCNLVGGKNWEFPWIYIDNLIDKSGKLY